MQKISTICWSQNGSRMAVATADRVVNMFDSEGERKDKFPTKPAERGQKSYVVRGLSFSPDNTKIAVAQSDNIVFIYKIGTEWGDKKSICNKFPQNSSVTCLVWPKERPNEIFFGLAEGKIKVGQLRTNKTATLYGNDSYCVSMSSQPGGSMIISGHLDCSILLYQLDNSTTTKLATHTTIPYALDYGKHIVAAGNDSKVIFYSPNGQIINKFDYTHDEKVKEFTISKFSPSGETCVIGNFNRFYVYSYISKKAC